MARRHVYALLLLFCGSTVVSIFIDDRLCFHCSGATSMARCKTFRTCLPVEDCYVHSNRSATGATFAAGCMARSTCSLLAADDPHGNCLQCCRTNLCGSDLCQTNTAETTTPTTTVAMTSSTTSPSEGTTTTTTTTTTTAPTTSTVSIPCQDDPNIHCSAIARQVCRRDDHFKYLLCRKTCFGCAGPRFTIPPVVPVTDAPVSSTYQECYYQNSSSAYNGFVNVSTNGETCEDWQQYVTIFYYKDSMFPDATVSMAKNHCRDPDHSGFPYCHTSSGIHKCAISECAEQCVDNSHTSCRVVSTTICPDAYVSRHLCPVTCNVCGYRLIPGPDPTTTPITAGTSVASSG